MVEALAIVFMVALEVVLVGNCTKKGPFHSERPLRRQFVARIESFVGIYQEERFKI